MEAKTKTGHRILSLKEMPHFQPLKVQMLLSVPFKSCRCCLLVLKGMSVGITGGHLGSCQPREGSCLFSWLTNLYSSQGRQEVSPGQTPEWAQEARCCLKDKDNVPFSRGQFKRSFSPSLSSGHMNSTVLPHKCPRWKKDVVVGWMAGESKRLAGLLEEDT